MLMATSMHNGASKLIFERAKELRLNATEAERILWEYLKAKPKGFHFRRQHPYGNYIFDFYCHKLKLVIEVDGSIHNRKDIKVSDQFRQRFIESDKICVLRFTNNEITSDLNRVISVIEQYLK